MFFFESELYIRVFQNWYKQIWINWIVFRSHVTIARCHGANRQVLVDLHQQLPGNEENKFALISLHKINRLYDYQDEVETAHHGKVQNLDPWSTDRVYQCNPYARKTDTIVNNNKIRKWKKKGIHQNI